jgi:TOMM system kinase/cyclase fusion protein
VARSGDAETGRGHPIEADRDFARRYALEEPLGQGGFARVFRATQRSTGQTVAVKILERGVSAEPGAEEPAARFRREVEICARIGHPNVVRLIDAGAAADGQLFAVFEYVPGRSLDRLLAEEGPLEPREATRLMAQVLDAIGCAHHHGVVHRDLKPANVIVDESGLRRNARILDFGVGDVAARREVREEGRTTGETVGTPAYAAPEQLRGERASPRSDLYAWGLVALECLTGEPAVRGSTLQEILSRQLAPEPVEIPEAVRSLPIGRALAAAVAKDPAERPASAAELLAWLADEAPRGAGARARPGTDPAATRERKRQLTVLCARAVASHEASLEVRDARLRAMRDRLLASVREYGGSVIAKAGSRVVAAFGYPRAREEAARAALQAAAAAREALAGEGAATLRAGVHSGVVIAPESLASWEVPDGAAVDTAVDLAARAEDGEILVSHATRSLLRGPAPLEPAGDVDLGGVDPIAVYRLTGGPTELRKAAPWTTPTPMIGRDDELARLEAAWQRARGGSPQACLVSGEAGIGKSRLLRELRQRVGTQTWIECRCTPETKHSPFQPIVDWLSAWVRSEPLETLLERLELDVAELRPLLAGLLELPPDPRYPARQLSPERRRERTLEAVVQLLFAAAKRAPLAFVLEDLHWADPTTTEWLSALTQEVRRAEIFETEPDLPLLVVLSARPDFEPPWSLPEVPLIQLARLPRQQAETLARAATALATEFDEEALDELVARADGVPLFLEEMGRMLSEAAREDPESARRAVRQVPATLRDLLNARIDRLHEDVRRTAQTAACLGPEFELPLLRTVARREDTLVRDDLDALIRSGVVFRRSRTGSERYLFHHALLRDMAHESMLAGDRRETHRRIAQSLQEPGYQEVAVQQPERLAYHFEEAGQLEQAIDFRELAGKRSSARSAHREAIHQLERALALLRSLPESAERDGREIRLQLGLGGVYIRSQGYAAGPVEVAFGRAMEVCNRFPEQPSLLPVLNGLWGYSLVRGEPDSIRRLVERQRELAESGGGPPQLLLARHAAGATAFYSGEYEAALPLLDEATRLYEAAYEQRMAKGGGLWRSPASSGPMYLGWCLHLVGRAEQGLARQLRALELAERLGDAYVHVEAMTHVVALLHDRREPERTLELSDRIVALAEELGFPFWLGIGKSARGWAHCHLGAVDDGTAEIEEGLATYARTGSMVPLVYRLSYLAEAHLLARRSREGIAVIDDALERCRGRLDRFYDAEMLRLRGELLLLEDAGAEGAEAEFLHALELARRQGARLFELRAAMSLARTRARVGRRDEARVLLAPLLGRFDEGFETPDLLEASALLGELGVA